MNRLVAACCLLALLALAGCTISVSPDGIGASETGDSYDVTVIDVVDGDTMDVRFADGSTDTIRLLGVDSPETRAENAPGEFEGIPDTDAGRQWLADWGDRATQYAIEELDGERVRIETDPRADRRGGYDRLLVYVYVDLERTDRSFNRALLDRGYARLYDSTFAERDAFASAEETARTEGVGLWGFESRSDATDAWLPRPSTRQPTAALAA